MDESTQKAAHVLIDAGYAIISQNGLVQNLYAIIELLKRNGLDATGEYNRLWSMIAAIEGQDEIALRQAFQRRYDDG